MQNVKKAERTKKKEKDESSKQDDITAKPIHLMAVHECNAQQLQLREELGPPEAEKLRIRKENSTRDDATVQKKAQEYLKQEKYRPRAF